jgi:predicted HTH domain antitoxin
MKMQITLTVPETSDFNPVELRIFTAAKLYEAQKLSLGQAAEAVELSKWEFAEKLGTY